MPDPTVSIITINRNSGDAVTRTIASVLAQDLPFEWVVIDGGSTDASLASLRAALRPGDRFISEPDRGISDAFNKGLKLASGDAVLFMNASDEFAAPDALRQITQAWDRTRYRWITGTGEVVDASGRVLFRRHVSQPADAFDLIRSGCRVFHQSTLTERRLLLEAGGFDLSYRIAMDYDLWCRLLSAGHVPQVEPIAVCRFCIGGLSGNTVGRFREDRRARRNSGLANPWWYDLRLGLIARLKALLRGRVGGWAYRFKELLRW